MAAWADAATVVPWTLYQASGDLGVLAGQFASMTAWVDEVTAAAGENRIWDAGFQYGDWLDPTAPAGRPEAAQTYAEIVATAYFARSARIVADAAALLGRDADAARYGVLADEVRAAFHGEYVARSGRVLSDSATAYALALQFDLIQDGDERRRAADRLAQIVKENQYRISTGFVGTPLICDALSANGHAETAYRLLLQTENPSWLYAVKMGATTIWERWDSLLPDGTVNPSGMTSFNHYAFGAVADWMHRVVAGLAPAAPGYRRLRFAPQPPRRGLIDGIRTTAHPVRRRVVGLDAGRTGCCASPSSCRSAPPPRSSCLPGRSHEVDHGTHSFEEPFDVEADVRKTVTVDTPLGELVDDAEAMAVLTGVITKYIPEAAEHMSGRSSRAGAAHASSDLRHAAEARRRARRSRARLRGRLGGRADPARRHHGTAAGRGRGFRPRGQGARCSAAATSGPRARATASGRSSWSMDRTACDDRRARPTTSGSTTASPRPASRPASRWAPAGTPPWSARSGSRSARRLAHSMSTSSSDPRSTSSARRSAAARSSTSPKTRCSRASSPRLTCRACRAPGSARRSSTSRSTTRRPTGCASTRRSTSAPCASCTSPRSNAS